MGGKHSRDKGKRGEREISKLLSPVFGRKVRRGWQSRQGDDECDVEGTPYWIEVKRRKKIGAVKFWEQAVHDSDGRIPVLFMRQDGPGCWLAVMDARDWVDLHEHEIGMHEDDQ